MTPPQAAPAVSGRDSELPADVVQSFLESATRWPGAPAVTCGPVTLTYARLLQRALDLSVRLRSEGISPEARVGICLDRSADWPVAILGVLLAGGAYVPIDAALPEERIAYKLRDSGITLLVSTTATAARHLLAPGTTLVDLAGVTATAVGDVTALPHEAAPGDLAYVIYTSGSTGRPKGVAIERGSLAFSTDARIRRYGSTRGVLLGVYPFSFDSSVAGLFWSLAVGGHYVISSPGDERDPHRLAALIERHRVTHLDCLPTHYATLLDYASDAALASVQLVIVGGEELTRPVWALHRRRLPHVPMHNEYGPTEATVWCCAHHLGHPEHFGRVPIGTALDGVGIRIEDPSGACVAPGTAGELLISGPGLARGYLNDAALSAERFVHRSGPDATGTVDRFYRTGDLVRAGEDGLLEFVGRLDRQVKVNGYRIELGEIETALAQLPEVRQAVAVVSGTDDHRRIIAYAVLEPGAMLTSTAMRRQLAAHLPAHMIPGMLVVLERMPATPNGKVDYAALPDPTQPSPRPSPKPDDRAASGDGQAERMLLAIWRHHLGQSDVQPTDNFFDLGGTSLQAIRAAAEAREAFGQAVDPREFFYRTLAQVAATLEVERR